MNKYTIIMLILIIINISYSQSVEIKDSADQLLLQINDEGDSKSSITIPSSSTTFPDTDNKLYNEAGTLKWNGNSLGTSASPLWTESGGNVYMNSGNVGIGITDPTFKLEVDGQLKITGGSPGLGKILTSDASGLATWENPALGTDSDWTELNGNIYNLDGNVGIGTESPNTTLDVNGTTSSKRYVSSGIYQLTDSTWDLAKGNLAQIIYSSSITPITISSDNTAGTYLLIVKKSFDCSDCSLIFLGATVKYPGGENPKLSNGTNTTDIFTLVAEGNGIFYCLGINDLK